MFKFYTSHCVNCRILNKLMDNKKIEYEMIDDENIYLPIAKKNGIMSMPFAEINGKVYTTKELQIYINNYNIE